jgi:signal transduction histidine kinase
MVMLGVEPLQQIAKNKDIEIQNKILDKKMVFVDSKMITTVIRNLVSNALKFTHRNGKIVLSVEEINSHKVAVHIADNGTGMEKETLDTLFELGGTTSSAGTENEPGSGFGLILCKEFVEKNNGKIDIQSQKGKGTTVRFSLPLAT